MLGQYRNFEINATDTALDMHELIRAKVSRLATLGGLSVDVEQKIANFLESNANGMFLWVLLIMEELWRRDHRL
jgi:hypothetical protein